ncbi:MAG: hypothetical protein M1827_006908 [Pycnora praestabilis]|nr:MAG: hypothetical protein M1827_006908 [Pycnora praestabilis]
MVPISHSHTAYEPLQLEEDPSDQPVMYPSKGRKPLGPRTSQSTKLDDDSTKEESINKTQAVQPQPLQRGHIWILDIVTSISMIAITLPLFAFAFVVHRLNNKTVDEGHWKTLHDIANKLATIFPIIFALVIGRTIRKIAAWKLERGARLHSLEQLMGSLTVGSTVTTQISLVCLNVLALLLIITWSLSPLGSQASLQVISVQQVPVDTSTAVHYFSTDMEPGFSEGDIWMGPSLDALYASSLMAPASIRNSPMDLWDNVKVPDLSRLSHGVTANDTGWISASSGSDVTYSSILGIPLSNFSTIGNTSFKMETSYISVSCINNTIQNSTSEQLPVTYTSIEQTEEPSGPLPKNGTYYGFPTNGSFSLAIDGYYQGTYGNIKDFENDTRTYEPLTLMFQSKSWEIGQTVAYCPITTTFVESQVSCDGNLCAVTAMRSSSIPHANGNLTNLGFLAAFGEFTSQLYTAAGNLHDATSSATELFIQNPDLAVDAGLSSAVLTNLTVDELSIGLQQVINAYWYGSYDPVSFMSGLEVSDSVGNTANNNKTAQAISSVYKEVYVCHQAWLFVFLLSTIIMFLAALIGAVLSMVNKGPELLGYCSSLIKDTPYLRGPNKGASALSGSERARKFKDIRLKLVDVEGEKEAGYIALVEDDGLWPAGKLKKGRLYR